MTASNKTNNKENRLAKGVNKVKKTALILATAGTLAGALNSCKDVSVGEGSKIEKSKTENKLAQFQKQWSIFINTHHQGEKSRLAQGPIILERGNGYSVLLSRAYAADPGIFTLSKINDNGNVGYSYNFAPGKGLINSHGDKGEIKITSTEEYSKVYDILINTLDKYNNRALSNEGNPSEESY